MAESSAVRSSMVSARRLRCLLGHPPLAQGEQGLPGDGLQHPPVASGQQTASECQMNVLGDQDVHIRLIRIVTRAVPGARDPGPLSALILQQGHGIEGEVLSYLLQQSLQWPVMAEHGLGVGREQRRLGPGTRGQFGPMRHPVHQHGDSHRDRDHGGQRELLGVLTLSYRQVIAAFPDGGGAYWAPYCPCPPAPLGRRMRFRLNVTQVTKTPSQRGEPSK